MMSFNRIDVFVLNTVLLFLSVVVVTARFYVRGQKKAGIQIDDWTALAALIGLVGVTGVMLDGAIKNYFGTHSVIDPETGSLSVTHELKNTQYSYIIQILSIPTLTLIKLSVILLYTRIFSISKTFRIYSLTLCTLTLAWCLSFTLATIFACGTHFSAWWAPPDVFMAFCNDTGALNVSTCITDVVFDLMVLLSPVAMILRLKMPAVRKVQVLLVFAMGFMSTAAAAVRTYIMWVDAYVYAPSKVLTLDVLEENTRVNCWFVIEIACALVGCCLPTLRPLFTESRSLGSVLRSFRSKLSLESGGSRISDEGLVETATFGSGGKIGTGRSSDCA